MTSTEFKPGENLKLSQLNAQNKIKEDDIYNYGSITSNND